MPLSFRDEQTPYDISRIKNYVIGFLIFSPKHWILLPVRLGKLIDILSLLLSERGMRKLWNTVFLNRDSILISTTFILT